MTKDQLLQPDTRNVKSTDAVLNCPGCFTPVCLSLSISISACRLALSSACCLQGYQCQRHEQFTRQWRASEVRNCIVDKSAALSMAKAVRLCQSCSPNTRGHLCSVGCLTVQRSTCQDDPAKYFAVRCETCKADVGLQDMDGIFHLFHVLESLA